MFRPNNIRRATSSMELLNVNPQSVDTTLGTENTNNAVKNDPITTTLLLRPHSPAVSGNTITRDHEDNDHQIGGTIWLWEILGWLLSLLFFTAIVGVLLEHNGKTVPHLPLNVKLNSIISILATFGISALMLPVNAGLGQLKWNRLRRTLPLAEFARLDQASRGPYGSLVLLGRMNAGSLPRLGALATVLSLAVGPFVQQVVTYSAGQYPVGQASIPVTNSWGGVYYDWADPVPYLTAAAYAGVFDNTSTKRQVSSTCSTGNCTFTEYETLSVCSACSNITALVRTVPSFPGNPDPDYNSSFVNYTLPNGFSMRNYEPPGFGYLLNILSVDSVHSNYTSVACGMNGSLLLDFFGIIASGKAFECILQWCVRGYSTQIINGQMFETPLYEWSNNSAAANGVQTGGSLYSDLILRKPGEAVDYYIHGNQLSVVPSMLAGLFKGTFVPYGGVNGLGSTNSMAVLANTLGLQFAGNPNTSTLESLDSEANFTTLFTMVDALAASLSVAIRSNPDADSAWIMANGTSWANETIVRVDWAWLALPFALAFACLVFLVSVILDTRSATRGVRLAALKTDILPVLLYGMDEHGRGVLQRATSGKSLAKVSEEVRMGLLPKTEGVRMVTM